MKLADSLAEFGVAKGAVVDLTGQPSPSTIRYLDLTRVGRRGPAAVIETQDQPVAYVVDNLTTSPIGSSELLALRRLLAFRGDAPYLAHVRPGELTVYEIGLDAHPLPQTRLFDVKVADPSAASAFQRLSMHPPAVGSVPGLAVHRLLFDLLNATISGLKNNGVDPDDAVSLAGRALFTRFLLDRGIINESSWQAICPKAHEPTEFFSDWENSTATCGWLDRTFNGDFLPLSIFPSLATRTVGSSVWQHLSDIMRKSEGGQLTLAGWLDIDLAHVPVGVLSEVYEQQAECWDPAQRREQGLYYTPRRLAEYMVAEVFRGLDKGPVPAHAARVLDPAVGGGVFLTTALRQLVAARWAEQGSRPDTAEIRQILYDQLAGFDLNETALRLAALSLYLTAIELDPHPSPIEGLKFEKLRDRVLFNVAGGDTETGSVSARMMAQHDAGFDVVIGNPPWTAVKASIHSDMVDAVRPIALQRLSGPRAPFQIPDHVPDLPFVWMSLAWAKPGGWLAFALHARLLFKETRLGRQARQDLFDAMTVTGVLNGADLAGSNVWPAINEPFCLLFGSNQTPRDDHEFMFVSPYAEPDLNTQGRLRIDHKDAHPVSSSRLQRTPGLLKALFRGTTLDVSLLERFQREFPHSVGDYWTEHGLASGDGYQIGTPLRQVHDASFLVGLPDVGSRRPDGLRVSSTFGLPGFTHPRAWRPRTRAIYEPPLVLVPEAPSASPQQPRAYLSKTAVAFSESFRGYSTMGHAEADLLAEYLTLLLHTRLFAWHLLITSGKFGYERRAAQSRDVDRFPLVPLEDVPVALRRRIRELLSNVDSSPASAWPVTDVWAGQLYGLDEWEMQVVEDTVELGFPFAANRDAANRRPEAAEMEAFCAHVEAILDPPGRAHGLCMSVDLADSDPESPWAILMVRSVPLEFSLGKYQPPAKSMARTLFDLADSTGASRVTVRMESQHALLVAILRKHRYWTDSRARLTAHELLDQHFDVIFPSS